MSTEKSPETEEVAADVVEEDHVEPAFSEESAAVDGVAQVSEAEAHEKHVSEEEVGLTSTSSQAEKSVALVSITFNIESLRFIAHFMFLIVMIICSILTKYAVDIPMDETVIYQIFGFNHACNNLDHHPAREVGAVLIIFAILPFVAFHTLSFFRTKRQYENGTCPKWLHTYNVVTTPFNILVTCWSYMWFVNNPDDQYGFLAHYIPYLLFQIMLAMVHFQQAVYLICIDKLPFRAKPWVAKSWVVFIVGLTIFYAIFVCSTLAGNPVLDSKNNDRDRLAAQIIFFTYSILFIFFPLAVSCANRKNGDVNTLIFD